MARPKTVKSNVDIEQPNNNNSNINTDDLIKQLMAKIENLEKQIKNPPIENEESNDKFVQEFEDIDLDIRADKYIKVISLCREKLNLNTELYGKGKNYAFPRFGSMRQIIYSDIVDIIHNNQKFIEEGRFYILDDIVIRKHGLLETYNSILTKEKIEKILDCNNKEALALYKSANEKQRKIIDQMLISKMRDGAEVDLNIISAISKIAGFDLYQKAEEAKQFKEITSETGNAS